MDPYVGRHEPDDSGAPGCHIPGWMTPTELHWLHDRAKEMSSVAEVGCLHGRSTHALLTGCPGEVWAIDPWDDPGEYGYPSFLSYNSGFANLRTLRMRSPAAAAFVPDVDMCFIDGDHSAPGVVADLLAWKPKTLKLLCGHDYAHWDYPDVKTIIDEWFPDARVAAGTGIWYVEL